MTSTPASTPIATPTPSTPNAATANDRPRGPSEAERLADQLERSMRGGAWHGPAVLEALDGVGAELAGRVVVPGVHTIQEMTRHAAFWLETARLRIEGDAAGLAAMREDWTPRAPGGGAPGARTGADDGTEDPEAVWATTRADLEAAHRRLHATVLALGDERLEDAVPGSDPSVRGLILGVLQHNAYHGGQIALLVRAATTAFDAASAMEALGGGEGRG